MEPFSETILRLESEIERLREDNERLKAEKKIMLFPAIRRQKERAEKAEARLHRIEEAARGAVNAYVMQGPKGEALRAALEEKP